MAPGVRVPFSSPCVSSSSPALAEGGRAGASPRPELRRQLGLGSATAVVAGEMIAVGIFLTPAGMIKTIGSPFWLLLVWLGMGLMALCGALCYGELAGRFPEAGGGYVYLREAYGNRMAFLYGWMCFLVTDPGITAALALGMAGYAGYVVPLSPLGTKALAIGALAALAAANVAGIRLGAALMRWLTLVKLGALAFIALWGLGLQAGELGQFPSPGRPASGFGAAGGGAGRRDARRLFLVRRMVGRHQDRR